MKDKANHRQHTSTFSAVSQLAAFRQERCCFSFSFFVLLHGNYQTLPFWLHPIFATLRRCTRCCIPFGLIRWPKRVSRAGTALLVFISCLLPLLRRHDSPHFWPKIWRTSAPLVVTRWSSPAHVIACFNSSRLNSRRRFGRLRGYGLS